MAKKMNDVESRKFMEELVEQSKKIGDKYGFEIEFGIRNLYDLHFTSKMKVMIKESEIDIETLKQNFIDKTKYLFTNEITGDDFQREVQHKGKTYKFVDIDLAKKKFCCVLKTDSGEGLLFSIDGYVELRKKNVKN